MIQCNETMLFFKTKHIVFVEDAHALMHDTLHFIHVNVLGRQLIALSHAWCQIHLFDSFYRCVDKPGIVIVVQVIYYTFCTVNGKNPKKVMHIFIKMG